MNVHSKNVQDFAARPQSFDGDGWFYPVDGIPAYADAAIEATCDPDGVEDAVAKHLDSRAGRLRTLVGRVLILPSAIVGFVGASDIDGASAAHRAALLQTLHIESRPGPAAPIAAAGAPAAPTTPSRDEPTPAASIPAAQPTFGVENDKTAGVKPAKKKRRHVAPQQHAPVAPSSDPESTASTPIEITNAPPDFPTEL